MSNSKYLHQSASDASFDLEAIATYYPGLVSVFIPNAPIRKLLPDWELTNKTRFTYKPTDKTSNESKVQRSVRRSQKVVTDLLLCNAFEYFLTITFAKDRHNINTKKIQFYTWIKNQRDRNGKFKYVFVPELHKDGAIHFHGVISGYKGKLRLSKSSKTGKQLYGYDKKPIYELVEFKSGFTRVEEISKSRVDRGRVSSYIRKYITKEMINTFGKKRYWSSQKLNKPIREDNPKWYKKVKPNIIYENEYGKIYQYNNLEDPNIPAYVTLLTSEDHLL